MLFQHKGNSRFPLKNLITLTTDLNCLRQDLESVGPCSCCTYLNGLCFCIFNFVLDRVLIKYAKNQHPPQTYGWHLALTQITSCCVKLSWITVVCWRPACSWLRAGSCHVLWPWGVSLPSYSVTRSGDLLEFSQIFKAFGNN